MLEQKTNGSYEQDYVRSGDEVSYKTLLLNSVFKFFFFFVSASARQSRAQVLVRESFVGREPFFSRLFLLAKTGSA